MSLYVYLKYTLDTRVMGDNTVIESMYDLHVIQTNPDL